MRGSLGLPEVALVEAGGPLEQRVEALSVSALPVLLGRRLLVVELHVEAIGEPLDRADEVDPLDLLHERDRVASLAAAEALEQSTIGRDAEARRPLLVERAQSDETRAGLAQAHVLLDDGDDVDDRLYRLDGFVLDASH